MDLFAEAVLYGGNYKKLDSREAEPRHDDSQIRPESYRQDDLVSFQKMFGIEKLTKSSLDFDWNTPVSVSSEQVQKRVSHHDGVEVEKIGNQTWRYHWENGAITKSEMEEGGETLCFDGNGELIAS